MNDKHKFANKKPTCFKQNNHTWASTSNAPIAQDKLTTWNIVLLNAFLEVLETDKSHSTVKCKPAICLWLIVGLPRKDIALPECVACLV